VTFGLIFGKGQRSGRAKGKPSPASVVMRDGMNALKVINGVKKKLPRSNHPYLPVLKLSPAMIARD